MDKDIKKLEEEFSSTILELKNMIDELDKNLEYCRNYMEDYLAKRSNAEALQAIKKNTSRTLELIDKLNNN